MTTEDVAEAFAAIDALHTAKAKAAPALALLLAHGDALEMKPTEIRRAIALPVTVCSWLESSPSAMCSTRRTELHQPALSAPDSDELADLILRWCLT